LYAFFTALQKFLNVGRLFVRLRDMHLPLSKLWGEHQQVFFHDAEKEMPQLALISRTSNGLVHRKKLFICAKKLSGRLRK
jgi:hypothetical protein